MYLSTMLTLLLLADFAIAVGNDNNKTLYATNEWQEIKEGQGIPRGLHVRINLKTGKKEAKLLEESEVHEHKQDDLSNVVKSTAGTNFKEKIKPPLKVTKSRSGALKNLPEESLGIEYSPEKLGKIKREVKTYKELKESYKDLQTKFMTEPELITQLIDEYKNLTKDEKKLSMSSQTEFITKLRILEDLDYLVHQIDNALWFIDKGGLDEIILPLIVNETKINLRVKAVRVLGAVTLNNPKAQIKAFERNFGSHLSQILISSTITEELSSALYAFGSLLRKFPLALQTILSTSGTQALIAVLAKECELKVKAKALTILNDVLVEKKLVLSKYDNRDNPLAAAQYAELYLSEWLQSNAFCETVDIMFSTKFYELFDQPDLTEYFIIGFENSEEICKSVWSKSHKLKHSLLTIKTHYMQSHNEFRIEVAQLIETLIDIIYSPSNYDEL